MSLGERARGFIEGLEIGPGWRAYRHDRLKNRHIYKAQDIDTRLQFDSLGKVRRRILGFKAWWHRSLAEHHSRRAS